MAERKTGDRNEEHEFLAGYDASAFDRPSLAVDVAILTVIDGHLEVALVERAEHPDKGCWALPGGFVQMDESLDRAASRVLAEKAGLAHVYLEQLYTFGEPPRDPRTRVISVAYYALVDHARLAAGADSSLGFGRIDRGRKKHSGVLWIPVSHRRSLIAEKQMELRLFPSKIPSKKRDG